MKQKEKQVEQENRPAAVRGVRNEDVQKEVANKIMASVTCVLCTPDKCQKGGVASYQMFKFQYKGKTTINSTPPPPHLSSATPDLTTAPAAPHQDQAAEEAQATSSVSLDPSQPVTNIQIRLADGSRLVQRFNHTHR